MAPVVLENKPVTEKKRSFKVMETTITLTEIITPRNRDIRLQVPPGEKLNFKAGQFVQVYVPEDDNRIRRTAYSIASSPNHQEYFDLCVTLVPGGESSGYIHSLKVGDKVMVMGPLGKFTIPDSSGNDLVFIATGSGIAPLRSMILNMLELKTSRQIYLVFGNRFDEDILYQKEWESLAKDHPNFHVLLTLSRPSSWTGARGYVQDHLQSFIPDFKAKDYYICGLAKMINNVQDKLLSLGVLPNQIHFERYD